MAERQSALLCSTHGQCEARVWSQLPPDLTERIVHRLDRNEIVATFRLVNKAAASQFSGPEYTTIRLSQPVPPHVFSAHWLAPGATRGLTLEQRRKLLCLTAASGVLRNLEVATQGTGCSPNQDAFRAAVGAGQLLICKWLLRKGSYDFSRIRTDDTRAFEAAAGSGHVHILEWLQESGPGYSFGAAPSAARSGHLTTVDWLVRQPRHMAGNNAQGPLQGPLVAATAAGCALAALQQRVAEGGWGLSETMYKTEALAAAAGSPTLDWGAKVEWLEAQGCPKSTEAAEEAAGMPNHSEALARLSWLRGRGYPADEKAVKAAPRTGNVAALQYLLAEAGVWPDGNGKAAEAAAEGGHLAALQALHGAGWPAGRFFARLAAARGGHVHVLAWMLEALGAEAVPLDSILFAAATESGSVELLAWLRDRGCDYRDPIVLRGAACVCCEAALEFLVELGCPQEMAKECYLLALENNDLATLRCLRRLGLPPRAFATRPEFSAARFPLPILRWLLNEADCHVDYDDARVFLAASGCNGHEQHAEAWALVERYKRLHPERIIGDGDD
ncbi:hypothetical protein GPECTOR_47g332 [Gonium pectorale]|uniref:F-box domain-containing protein n=1 Tax=Gonium pectorale TaxID=33097 RepID=A0A150G884_GONPE|nr:hypothetical protein GPECTOR_47g332 [Gonium pectorale]|eukprot:KXZ46057.1 hypothetical protein GPECTOR_47g332 [Gonium pectorale]